MCMQQCCVKPLWRPPRYELKLAQHGQAQPGSVQTGLTRAMLENSRFLLWETVSLLGLIFWLLSQLFILPQCIHYP